MNTVGQNHFMSGETCGCPEEAKQVACGEGLSLLEAVDNF